MSPTALLEFYSDKTAEIDRSLPAEPLVVGRMSQLDL
jgi:hypothetical protein